MPSVDIVAQNRIANTNSPLELATSTGAILRLTPNSNGQIAVSKDGTAVASPFLRPVIAKTASYTCVAGECGALYTSTGAGGAIIFTLPAVATSAGLWFEFVCTSASGITVTAPAGTMVTFNNAAATSAVFTTAGNMIGAGGIAYCDGAKWLFRPSGANTLVVA